MEKRVVIINGYAESGKDSFVELAKEFVQLKNYSSVDEIKEFLYQIGWNGKKDNKTREFICELKRMLTAYNDYPFECLKKEYEAFKRDSTYVLLFLHIREPEEIKRAVREFKAVTLLIMREKRNIYTNSGDANVDNYKYDYVIENNGSKMELCSKVKKFLDEIGLLI
ncbi:nucleoside/nucleotide kinase family protein [[Clostridium] polysaccharolyticum]|uniref:AAA domain-containing protein n=1 Tax=[Clostridium] polysaccharolyticum TaxID=29364 RepID=A0A1I0FTA3_9FIRM|nr:hypothetical protein [[Clostridium] polysaccharolyticum]SET61420.1 hypothetical protein SAMN04487772_13720 [[Clostridium] polysaccharolyticum]